MFNRIDEWFPEQTIQLINGSHYFQRFKSRDPCASEFTTLHAARDAAVQVHVR